MGLTLNYQEVAHETTTIRMPKTFLFVALKAKQILCTHNWKTVRNITLFGNKAVKLNKCCKCKAKQTKAIQINS